MSEIQIFVTREQARRFLATYMAPILEQPEAFIDTLSDYELSRVLPACIALSGQDKTK